MLNRSNAYLLFPRVRLIFILASLTSAFAVPSALAQPVKFVAAPTVARGSAGYGAYKAFVGRFSRGGRLDVVFSGVTPSNGPNVYNYAETALNQGGGTFTTVNNGAGLFYDGFTGADLGADLNGDGITDAITLCGINCNGIVANQIQIQLGAGDGTFGESSYITLAGGASPNVVAVGDFDGNGSTDIAVLTSSDTLVILLNDGNANFHTAFTYKLSAGSGNGGLLVGDFNGDTLADVALIYGGNVTPFLSTHGGALTRGTTVVTAGSPAAVVDVNHDGFADIALLTSTGVQFLLGSSSGQLKAGKNIPVPGLSPPIVFADFNNDGVLDLATAGSASVSVYLGNSTGSFGSPTVYGTGNSPVSLMAGDFYGSGKIDLMTFDDGDAGLSLLQNIGGGHFQAAPVTHSSNATGIVAGDFNRDGKQDVAVVNTPNCKAPCKGTVTVFPGTGSNYFNPGKTYPIGMHGAAIAAGDLNHDGILDLVVVNSIAGDAADTSVLLGKADGTFQPARNYTLGSLSHDVVLADMNKDGNLDLVTAGGVALGKGDGTFAAPKPFPGFSFDPTLHFAVADVNGDGKLDVVLVDSGSDPNDCTNQFQVLLGDGKGGFTTGQNIFNEGGNTVTSIALARLRAGGAYDIVYSYWGGCGAQAGGEILSGAGGYIGDGHGTGTFTNTFGAIGGEAFSDLIVTGPVVVADFNGDGKPDIGVGMIGHFAVALGNGDETFQPQQLFTVDYEPITDTFTTIVPGGIVVADFLKDGKPDVALTSGLGVARLYNATP